MHMFENVRLAFLLVNYLDGKGYGKNYIGHKMCVLFFTTTSVPNHFHCCKIRPETNVCLQAVAVILPEFNQNWNLWTHFSKIRQYQISRKSFSDSRVLSCLQMNGQTNFFYYYLLTAIGLMPGGSVYRGYTVNKEHSTPVSRKDDTYISRYNTNTVARQRQGFKSPKNRNINIFLYIEANNLVENI
jgi:hypothetical protein